MKRYKLSRLTIDKDYRKHRFGRLLVERLHKWIQEDAKVKSRPAEVECHSHLATIEFYAKFGYLVEGPQFEDMVINVALQRMILQLQIPE
ncbi:hypothetical protein B0H19DRAFT_1180080 [Mycena capillaripes]|nr:hypothetical protein B0H19DRAFT_1180080 [Mycena capillaripes]